MEREAAMRNVTARPDGDGAGPGAGRRVLIAEDDASLSTVLLEYLARCDFAVQATDRPEHVRRWLHAEAGPVLLDGSVFRGMGISLADLPKAAVIYSGDAGLVEEARRLGLRALRKGSLNGLGEILRMTLRGVEDTPG
jgi:hypothetical protein